MPKRGSRQPYRVSYQWDNGIKGATARYDLDDANLLADQIEASARSRELGVTITVLHVETPGAAGVVIATRTIDPEESNA